MAQRDCFYCAAGALCHLGLGLQRWPAAGFSQEVEQLAFPVEKAVFEG